MAIVDGERFSLNYVHTGEPSNDSRRARVRLFRAFKSFNIADHVISNAFELRTGAEVDRHFNDSPDWDKFFRSCKLRDLLDFITVTSNLLLAGSRNGINWLAHVNQIFREENLCYRTDSLGGVHFSVDEEFERNHSSALSSLQQPRYEAALHHFEQAQVALSATPPLTREAVRQTFDCAETIFKLMFPDQSRLGASEITKKLRPLVNELYSGTERDVLVRYVESFKEWVNGTHSYRHGQGTEKVQHPTLDAAVLSVSLGASFIRWLVSMDTARPPSPSP